MLPYVYKNNRLSCVGLAKVFSHLCKVEALILEAAHRPLEREAAGDEAVARAPRLQPRQEARGRPLVVAVVAWDPGLVLHQVQPERC